MGGEKIRKHSRLTDDLPEEVRRDVDALLVQGSATYDEIKDYLAAKGFDISRSSIGRYGKDFLAMYREVRIIEDQSRTLVSESGEGMILEEAVSKLFSKMIIEAQLLKKLDIKKLPRIISDFAKLQASTVMRERFKADIGKKADKAISNIEAKVKKKSIDPETLKIIKEEIYGIV